MVVLGTVRTSDRSERNSKGGWREAGVVVARGGAT